MGPVLTSAGCQYVIYFASRSAGAASTNAQFRNTKDKKRKIKKTNTEHHMQYNTVVVITTNEIKQEAQLMLTNPRDAFRGQSRSPNIVPFHVFVLHIVSY